MTKQILHTWRNPTTKERKGQVFHGVTQTDPSFNINMRSLVDRYLRLPPEDREITGFDQTPTELNKLDRLELAELVQAETEKAEILAAENKAKKAAEKLAAQKMPVLKPDPSDFEEVVDVSDEKVQKTDKADRKTS